MLASWLIVSLAGQARGAEPDDATSLAAELVATMKIDEQASQKVENEILAWCHANKCDADLRRCLMKFDREEITEDLEDAASSALTPDEMKAAIAYFRTETGLKHLDVLRAERGLGGDATLFNQSPEDRARMLGFLDTRAGYLIITRQVLTSQTDRWTTARARWAIWRCKPGT
jgi:hypothetical protein